jgi:hypothetical protein
LGCDCSSGSGSCCIGIITLCADHTCLLCRGICAGGSSRYCTSSLIGTSCTIYCQLLFLLLVLLLVLVLLLCRLHAV